MKHEKYADILVVNNYLEYQFTSIGPKGAITKTILFTPTQDDTIVNLALGNKKEDGGIDDLVRCDNKDRNRILATVISVLQLFFEAYPGKRVFFAGSTPERTRLYRMAIALYYEQLASDFDAVGVVTERGAWFDVPFERGGEYAAFLVQRRNGSVYSG